MTANTNQPNTASFLMIFQSVCVLIFASLFMVSPGYAEDNGLDFRPRMAMCRGGGEMQLTYHSRNHKTVDKAWAHKKKDTSPGWISLTFKKASQGGNKKFPNPGECAWYDAPISENLPDMIRIATWEDDNPQITISCVQNGCGAFIGRDDWKYLVNAIKRSESFYLHMYACGYKNPQKLSKDMLKGVMTKSKKFPSHCKYLPKSFYVTKVGQ